MGTPIFNPAARRAIVVARLASIIVALAGGAVLFGWIRSIPEITSLYLPGPTLKTNGAVALFCGAMANVVLTTVARGRRAWLLVVCGLALVPTVVGGLTLYEHVTAWDLGLDQLIATEAPGAMATTSPNRTGPIGSVVNLLLGISLLYAAGKTPRRRAASHLLAFTACIIALLPLIGYIFGYTEFYMLARYTAIALVNAMALLLLGMAIQAGNPDVGMVALICREDEVGVFARRMLPAAILLPLGSGLLLARTLRYGFVDAPFAISAMSLVLIILMAGVIWRTGKQLVLSLDARAASERALAESERTLRNTDQQKTEFLATLSHELRNPLAPIRFAVELLNGPPAIAERARQTIERQVRHLTRLIDDLLDLTRINRNKLELHARPCELAQLVTDAVDAVSTEIKAARHHLEINLPSQPVWLNVDPDRVIQMFVNLLTNATRYSDPGGNIAIGAKTRTGDVTIYVKDSGRGLEPADLHRVFERFVQVGKTPHGGLGIGLALVKALAELHGGSVEAHSEGLGHGAEFRVRLPRAAAAPRPAGANLGLAVAPCRILVVDDNRDAADMLGRLLATQGHKVLVAYDGAEALRESAEFKPQIGLLDIGMPGMDGHQLASELRRQSQSSELFVVAITGWGQEEDRRRALAAGFDAHLTKPADPEQIGALLAARFPMARADASASPAPDIRRMPGGDASSRV
jgi:signal transduction histidine kinase/CheY-like chemotaxis protein